MWDGKNTGIENARTKNTRLNSRGGKHENQKHRKSMGTNMQGWKILKLENEYDNCIMTLLSAVW